MDDPVGTPFEADGDEKLAKPTKAKTAPRKKVTPDAKVVEAKLDAILLAVGVDPQSILVEE